MKNVLLTLFLLTGAALTPVALAQTTATPAAPQPTTPALTTPTTPVAAPVAPATPAAPTATAPAPKPAVQPDESAVVAQVGAEKVALGEFNRDFRIAAARIVNQQGIPFDEAVLKEFAVARPDFLKQYARQRGLYQLARASVKPDQAAVNDQVAKARADFKTNAEFTKALVATGYNTPEVLRGAAEQQNVINTYLGNVQKKFKVSDTSVGSYYALHKSAFTAPAQACVKHILVPTKAEADSVVKSLSSGGNFATLAQAKSQDPGSAAKGGDLGCLSAGQTVPAFDKASFSGPVGKTQVVQSEYGWHVLVVTRRTPAGIKPLKDVSEQIRDQLSRDAAQKYLDSQIARLNIKTFPELVAVAAPAAVPATPLPAKAPAAVPTAPAPTAPVPATSVPAAPVPATK
ncbi:peptidylprolyl isomerase [Deinococcus sp.]|uniref:peptidylprolyl isomerase n=1 Tax=Deinococcus sp. TaxID=47478 RepID=UPI0025BA2305|nr:peptidylprolyl isomerase [Deinococcus sp.]